MIEAFLAVGYTQQQVLEVIHGIAIKIHNYTNVPKRHIQNRFNRISGQNLRS